MSNHHRTINDRYNMSKSVQLQVQGQSTRWLNYIQQNNLILFHLTSTFDILPSPTNLKRWRTTAIVIYTLCSKNVHTTTLILGACKVLLQKGRYTFRYGTVLHKIIESLKSVILNINQAKPISSKSSIKFVKREQKSPSEVLLQLAFYIRHQTGFF